MDHKIREFIVEFFMEKGKFSGLDKSEFLNINFIEEKHLDSIEFITLISEIEENFGLVFTEDDIQSSLFSSIEGIVKITNSRFHSGHNHLKN